MKFFSLILCILFAFNVSASGFLPIANIVKIHGEAFINKEVVAEGAEVAQGMEIKIPKKGDYIIVKFQNGHKVRFTEATVKVEELTEKITLLTLIKGQVHTFVNKLTKDEKFSVKTKYASFAVRGTKFGVSIDDKKKQAYLCVCEGVVNTTQNKMSVDVKKDEDIWVGLNAKKLIVKQSTAQMQNMTSQIIDEMDQL
ncbi:FecR domain-containing protein [Bacteriovorax sp. PP10]|uniref:FecR domain-containing protein n=1 Tax=Bacteriovorax antarcticus TaxID=3088717 RepID=A0ABU5VS23_9BACT|nr:FecR domain-containing protein [Bacteriovorax sp. PP10]MEA9355193.1 FecR domain-containing protein [Bacteriovorax sp. PP10]